MAALDEYKTDLSLLVEIGMIAIKQGDEESAVKLFQAAHLLDQTGQAKLMGEALIAVQKLDLAVAQKNFETLLEKDPKDARIMGFLAFTYMLKMMNTEKLDEQKQFLEEGVKWARKAKELADDQATVQLAESIFAWEEQIIALGIK